MAVLLLLAEVSRIAGVRDVARVRRDQRLFHVIDGRHRSAFGLELGEHVALEVLRIEEVGVDRDVAVRPDRESCGNGGSVSCPIHNDQCFAPA